MYYILDNDLRIIGSVALTGNATPFYNDLITMKIADDSQKIWSDTLSINIPYDSPEGNMLTIGNHIIAPVGDGEKWHCYRIYNVEEELLSTGIHTKKADCYNLAIWDFYHTLISEREFYGSTQSDLFQYLLQGTSWLLGDEVDYFELPKSLKISEGTAQAAIDSVIQTLECEVEAYIVVTNGKIRGKRINFIKKLGNQDNLTRFEYSKNLTGVKRSVTDLNLFTKLYVYGGNTSGGTRSNITAVNGGVPYLLNEVANDEYNAGGKYLEGSVTNQSIISESALLSWGKKQLEFYSKPHYEYTVDVALLESVNLGDKVYVIDRELTPELYLEARVIEVQLCESDSTQNKIILGDFIEVTVSIPASIYELQALANEAMQKAETASSWKVELFAPNGIDFSDIDEEKEVIARVYSGMENITHQILDENFEWLLFNSDGTINAELSAKYSNKGNVIMVTSEVAGYTLQCNIKDTKLVDSLFFAKEEDLKFFKRIKLVEDVEWTAINSGVIQYAHYDYENGYIYWSKVSGKPYFISEEESKIAESFLIIRTGLDCVPIDYMFCKWGGHGSHYGFYIKDGTPTFISQLKVIVNNKPVSWACEYPYQPFTTITSDSPSVTKIRRSSGRLNLDERNGMILDVSNSSEKSLMKVYFKSDYYSNKELPNPIAQITASEFGVVKGQTYQSSCLDYPYLYVTYGFPQQEGFTYCVDLKSKSLVYRIKFEYTLGNINYYHNHAEPETINYYYDSDGIKHMYQGFALRNPVYEINTRQNELYEFVETMRVIEEVPPSFEGDDYREEDE